MAKTKVQNAMLTLSLDTDKVEALTAAGVTTALMGTGLYIEGERIMTDSKENYTPVGLRWYGHRPGNLRRSGTVVPPEYGPGSVRVRLTYDINQAPYAFIVHERDPSIGQGKNKYLEKPFLAAMSGIEDRLGAYLQPRINDILAGRSIARDEWRQYQHGDSGDSGVGASQESA